jgi:hypothetical protein
VFRYLSIVSHEFRSRGRDKCYMYAFIRCVSILFQLRICCEWTGILWLITVNMGTWSEPWYKWSCGWHSIRRLLVFYETYVRSRMLFWFWRLYIMIVKGVDRVSPFSLYIAISRSASAWRTRVFRMLYIGWCRLKSLNKMCWPFISKSLRRIFKGRV